MKFLRFLSHKPQETVQLGKKIVQYLKPGDIVCLFGDLGSGKTTFVKGMAQGLGINRANVLSPTFVLMHIYEGRIPLYHFDFYRLDQPKEIMGIGYEEFFYGDGITVVEWADRLKGLIPKQSIRIKFSYKNKEGRLITISTQGQRYRHWIKNFKK